MANVRKEHLKELEDYELKDVQTTGKQVGQGAYGYVEKVLVHGAICAAKKVYRILVHNYNEGVEIFKQKFFSECVIMSKLRHPHVVQFMGVYFPSDHQKKDEALFEASIGSNPPSTPQGLSLPWLIMEYLPMNLDGFLNNNSRIPYSVKSSLLLDISKGLLYLHSQKPAAIIHRDLTAKNILINSAMVAKIADFGVARITDPFTSTMSVGPGTIVYMPPEVQGGDYARYFTGIDIFSFGVIILYTIIQKCPQNLKAATYPDPEDSNKLIAVSEVMRREKYFDMAHSLLSNRETAPEHRLIGLAKNCLCNDPHHRPAIQDLLGELKIIKEEFCDQLLDKDKFVLMQMAREKVHNGCCTILEEDIIQQSKEDHDSLSAKILSLEDEREQLEVQNKALEADKEFCENGMRSFEEDNRRLKDDKRRLESIIISKDQEIGRMITQEVNNEKRRQSEFEVMEQELRSTIKQRNLQMDHLEKQLRTEMEINESRKQAIDMLEEQLADQVVAPEMNSMTHTTPYPTQQQQGDVSECENETEQLKSDLKTLKQRIFQMDRESTAVRREAQLLREQLIQNEEVIERLKAVKLTVPGNLPPPLPESGIKVTLPLFWKQCLPTPSSLHCGQCVRFGTKLLYGGGNGTGDNKRKILKFDLMSVKWSEFSLYLYEHFAMAVVMNKLMVVGGYDSMKDEYSSRVSEWREVGCNWVRIQGSPLPTPRADAAAVGYKKWLIVAGGFNGSPLDRVDILDCENFGQWHSLLSLPEPVYSLQSTFFQDTSRSNGVALWYLISTSRGCGLKRRRPVFYVSIPQLIERRGTWTVIPDPPLSDSGAVTVRGHLLAVGGRDQHLCKKDVYMYFPGTSEWLKVSEIQYPRHSCSCVALSDKKFVVVGGEEEEEEYSCKVDQYNIDFN